MSNFYLAAKEIGWRGIWDVTGLNATDTARARNITAGYEFMGIYIR